MISDAERHIQLPLGCVGDNIPNRPLPKRANHTELARGAWGQLK